MNAKENGKKVRIKTHDVYVGHVPKVINQDKLKNVFLRYGEVIDVICRHGPGNGPLGYAIVKFKYKEDVDRLLNEVDKVHVNGYEMDVRLGVKSSSCSSENEEVAQAKSVSFSEQISYVPIPSKTAHMMDSSLCRKEAKCMSTHNEPNGKQMQVVELVCTHVDSSVTFHGCYVHRYDELQNIRLKLNSICPNLVRLNRKPMMKRVYAALYEDFHWYRCIVRQVSVSSKPGVCLVEYIDYGNIAEVFYTHVVDLPEPLQKINPCSVKCVFSNLMCNPSCRNDVTYLHHLVNKRMTLSAVLKSYSSWGIPEYQVYNCSSNGIDVISELVRNGYAIYRSQQYSKYSHPSHNLESIGYFKAPESKPKKAHPSKGHPKKAIKEACNGTDKSVEKNVHSGAENGICDTTVKSPKSASPDNLESSEDFVPKRIIKRGCEINGATPPAPVSEVPKCENVSSLLKVDCVLSNLKLVNNIRNLVSFPVDDSLVNDAVSLLNEGTSSVSQDQNSVLEEAHKKYQDALNNIKKCSDEKLLPDLKEKRNQEKSELLAALKHFLDSFDSSLFAKQKKIQELITALGSNSNTWMNVCVSSPSDEIEGLIAAYHKERDLRWSIIQNARENTNEKHKKFMDFLGDIMKEFALNLLDGEDSCHHLENSGGKRGSYSLKFEEALNDLGIALEEEMKTCSVSKGRNDKSIIKCILEKLDVPKERIDSECEIYSKYKYLLDDLEDTSDLNPLFEELQVVQKNIQSLILDCAGDPQKLESRTCELHKDLLKEEKLLEKLAEVSVNHFPELVLEHPEFDLLEYKNNWYMFKSSWQKNYFPVLETCKRIEPAYISKFSEDLVVIKEFDTCSETERKSLIKKAILWNEIKCSSLAKIQALFNKDETGVYIMFPQVWDNLFDNPLQIPVDYKLACNILQQILKGLVDIHERGLAHGAVHPMAVLRKDDKVLLDFNYDWKLLQDNLCLKGINFKDPSGDEFFKPTDMYGFGCLVLWVLFPNLSFTKAEKGVPNILAFQSIIQELLPGNEFSDLSNLLSPNTFLRPTAKDLYKKGFLKDLRSLLRP